MKERMLRVGVLVVALFAINAVFRLVTRFGYGDGTADDIAAQDRLGWLGWGALALAMAVAAGWWIRQRTQGEVARELGAGALIAGLLYVAVGPYLSEPPRFEDGLGEAIIQLSIYLGVAGLGGLVGALLLIMIGRDHQSQQLRRYAESRSGKPGRRG